MKRLALMFAALACALALAGCFMRSYSNQVSTSNGDSLEYRGVHSGRVARVVQLPLSRLSTNQPLYFLEVCLTNDDGKRYFEAVFPSKITEQFEEGDLLAIHTVYVLTSAGGQNVRFGTKFPDDNRE